jgi:AAA15 family ATPase/GTPase
MIKHLTIRNFKSIKELSIECKKLNVFIGDPNSGKSNIIEALALQSQNSVGRMVNKNIFRYQTIGDLFYDYQIDQPIEVVTDERKTTLKYGITANGVVEDRFLFFLDENSDGKNPEYIEHSGSVVTPIGNGTTNVHLYEYKRLERFVSQFTHLSVPYGENLGSLLLSNSEYKQWVSDFLKSKGLRLTLKPVEREIQISKIVGDEIYSYPYFSLSETLQKIIFYTIAIKSNKDSVLLFDEPESNTFPFYTKFMAESIALDENNQFFITTHNPYLLLNMIEKSKTENLNVCIVQMEDFATKVTILNEEQVAEVLDLESDAFFNFDKILAL